MPPAATWPASQRDRVLLERAADPLHCAGSDPKLFGNDADTGPSRSRQRLTDSLFQCGGDRRKEGFLLPLQNPAHISRLRIRVAHNPTIGFSPGTGQPLYADVMAITRMSILFRFTERVHITVRRKQRVGQKAHGHGHIRGRALPPWPLGAARRAVRGGRRCGRSRIQSGRGASAQRRRPQEASAARPEAWKRKPTAEVVLRFVRRRAGRRPTNRLRLRHERHAGAAHEGPRGSAFARAIAFSYSPNL
jgi:hypothetical protein